LGLDLEIHKVVMLQGIVVLDLSVVPFVRLYLSLLAIGAEPIRAYFL
jgi:hypothetical protein